MTAQSRRPWVAKLALLAASLLVVFLAIEVLIRLAGMDSALMWQPDRQVGWWHIPGARMHWTEEGDGLVAINALGMRDVNRTVVKPAGVFRIAFFGDSMTEAVQVNLDQTFTQLLEQRLRKRGVNAEVLNFGVNGYSALQGYLLYKRVAAEFKPDLVVHAVFLDNDIADGDLELAVGQSAAPFVPSGTGPQLAVNYTPAEVSYRDYHREPTYTARRLSATYRLISALRWKRLNAQRYETTTAAGGGVPQRYMVYADPLEPRWEAAWSTYRRILNAFAADTRAGGTRFAVLSVPAGHVVDERAWQGVLAANPAMSPLKWQMQGPDDKLRQHAAEAQVLLLEPMAAFRKDLPGTPLFFGGIGHLTPRGHEVMASFLEQSLLAQGLVANSAAQGIAR